MSAAAAYKPAHGGYPGTVRASAVWDTGKRKAAELHEILCKIAREVSGEGPGEDFGLCILVSDVAADAETCKRLQTVLREAIEAWSEYSGYPEYPVDDPTGQYTPRGAYAALRKWGDTPYGRARRRLLWHCIDWCEAVMAE